MHCGFPSQRTLPQTDGSRMLMMIEISNPMNVQFGLKMVMLIGGIIGGRVGRVTGGRVGRVTGGRVGRVGIISKPNLSESFKIIF